MDYARAYASQDTMTVGTQRTTDLMVAALENDEAGSAGSLIADIACGKGTTACALSTRFGCRVLAFDLMPAFLADARDRVRAQRLSRRVGVAAADGKQVPLPDASCDAACCLGAPSIVGLPAALNELARMVRPGGLIVVSDAFTRQTASGDTSLPADLPELPIYLRAMEAAGLSVDAQHLHPLDDWRDYLAPLRRTADRARAHGDNAFADELLTSVEQEWQAAQTALDYVTIIARRR